MKRIADYLKNNKYLLILIYWPIHFAWYEILRLYDFGRDVLMIYTPLDDKIPFCEWFVIPYILWYAYMALVIIFSTTQGKREFLRADCLVMGCMAFSMIFATLIPNGIEEAVFRPDFATLGRENFAIELVKGIYNADTPARCVMPSMHTSVSWVLFVAVLQNRKLKKSKIIVFSALTMSILVTLATVLIRQHSILDVFGGLATAVLISVIVYLCEKYHDRKKLNN